MQTPERPYRTRSRDFFRTHLTLWVALVLLAGVITLVHVQISLFADLPDNEFTLQLISAGNGWLVGTLPVVLAGGAAIAVAQRRASLLLAGCFVLGSTVVEVVGYATWSTLVESPVVWWREAIYAVSAVFLAAAWLTARAWGPSALLASPIAGIASWFALPHLTAAVYNHSEMRWGSGTEGQFVGVFAASVIEVLVFSLPALVLMILRWVRKSRHSFGSGSRAEDQGSPVSGR